MAAVVVDPDRVHEFEDMDGFYRWLAGHHASEREVWIKIHKVKSGLRSITPEAGDLGVALCWGWIDGHPSNRSTRRVSCNAIRRAGQEERLEPGQHRQCRAADRRRKA